MPREFLSQVEEVRFFQRNPHRKPPGGYTAIPDVAYDDPSELEFNPQDKKGTLDYRHLTEQEPPTRL